MIISGISTNIPTGYDEVIRRLRMLGITPTGNRLIDRGLLKQAIEKKLEAFELKKEQEKVQEENLEKKKLMEEQPGAQALAEQNKIFLKLLG